MMGFKSWVLGEELAAQVHSWRELFAGFFPPSKTALVATPIGEAREGVVQRFVGQLESCAGVEPLVAPLTGRRCAYYELTVEELQGRPGNYDFKEGAVGGHTMHLFDWGAQDFFLADGSGRVRVHQQTPSVGLHIDRKLHPKIGAEVPPELQAVLARLGAHKAKRVPQFKGTTLLLREGVLEPGERINIWATPSWKVGIEGNGYRESGRELWLEGGEGTGQTLFITDEPQKE